MKIGLVGAIDTPINKNSTAGTEVWTYNFAERLIKLGHHVTLFANDASAFSGKLINVVKERELLDKNQTKKISPPKFSMYSVKEMVEVVKKQADFDVIHISVYSFHYLLPLVDLISKPVVITIHGTSFPDSEIGQVFKEYPKVNYVFISKQYEKKWPYPEKYRVIYNGIEVDKFECNKQKGDYFFWMSRISLEKGVDDAIEFAEKTGNRLIIAGPIRDQSYFDLTVKPHLSKKIEYVGKLDFSAKNKYYKSARAFLMPIKWEEPFGLVVVEALACGTPVIAYNRGAIPEIIEDGKSGFLVNDVLGMIEADKQLKKISSQSCRERAEKFTLKEMVNNYLDLYKEILKK